MTRTMVQQPRAMALAVLRVPVTPSRPGVTGGRAHRMARFAEAARRLLVRAFATGGLVAAGWLIAVLFGAFTATPAAADTTAAMGTATETASGAEVAVSREVASGAEVGASQEVASRAEVAVPVRGASGAEVPADASVTPGAGVPAAGQVDGVRAGASSMGWFPSHLDVPTAGTDNAAAMAGRTVNGVNSQQDPGLPAPSSAAEILDTNGLVPSGGNGPFGPGMGDVTRSLFDPRLQIRRAPVACGLPLVVRTAADDPSFSPD
ncbi:hypothetical protein [Nonomuraea pusilla]|uniref:Uncharacterized protein n=1 Tax=Nonomuraea pusilla TaxID=46177 RepID=A0A1H8D0R0_9ACTN|nr:hypothetical protein [Nonomuraea pusilla]SEN00870.1 hypothetical protein SAMN05660976_06620 [Nonomuraea pusilla]